jgi:hypothetical protein
MKDRSPSFIRKALSLLSLRLVLQQICLALASLLLFALWLHVPDGTVLDIFGSVTLAVLVVAIAGVAESTLMLRLSGRSITPKRLLSGAVLLSAGAALWLLWSALMTTASAKDSAWAGYLNSQLPHSLRYAFTWTRIFNWLDLMFTVLQWVGAGALFTVVFVTTASMQPLHTFARVGLSVRYWFLLVLGSAIATLFTKQMMAWTPGHGLLLEVLSLALRLSSLILLDGVVVCLVLAVVGVYVHDTNARALTTHSTPGGIPERSQPRTVETP